jgi:hypothetical protein
MDWKHLLAYITGTVEQELLLRNEYLATENRILHKRNHQGKGNVLLFPSSRCGHESHGPMQCRERLGGLLKYYEREAA